MFGQQQHAERNQHDERTEEDGLVELREHPVAGALFVERTFQHKNRVVVALSEEERGEDDVDDIELNTCQLHDAENPNPRDGHRQESDDAEPEAAKREAEE